MTIKELDDKLNSPGFQDTGKWQTCFITFLSTSIQAEKEYDIQ